MKFSQIVNNLNKIKFRSVVIGLQSYS